MFLAGVSLAVAAIPEGLPAIGGDYYTPRESQRMIKKNAIVRKLPAVETLGCASVICSDKTSTMTQNEMTVTHLWSGGQTWTVDGVGYEPRGSFFKKDERIEVENEKALQQMLMFGMLCNHAELVQKKKDFAVDGDPTEGALLVSAMKAGYNREQLLNEFEIVEEFPFDSTRKMMSVIIKDQKGRQFVVTKGAPDVLVTKSEAILWNERKQLLSQESKETIQTAITGLASPALRTIAIGFKEISSKTIVLDEKKLRRI